MSVHTLFAGVSYVVADASTGRSEAIWRTYSIVLAGIRIARCLICVEHMLHSVIFPVELFR